MKVDPFPVTPKPTLDQITEAAMAAMHLRGRLEEPRFESLFDSLSLSPEQERLLRSLAHVGAYHVEDRARKAAGGAKGGRRKSQRKTKAVRKNAQRPRKTANPPQ